MQYHLNSVIVIFLVFFQIFMFFEVYNIMMYQLTRQINEPPAQKIFCMILTQRKNIETKAKSVLLNWANQCDDYIFSTSIPPEYISRNTVNINGSIETYVNGAKIVQPNGLNEATDKYKNLSRKVFLTFKDIYNRYGEFDWYLKADDDTFIMMENLRDFLKDKSKDSPVSYGYRFDDTWVKNGYHSGGSGYVLSKESMQRLGKELDSNFSYCSDWGIEDLDMGKCLRKLGVQPADSLDEEKKERFHFASFKSHFWSDFSGPKWKDLLPAYPIQGVSYF